MTVERAHRLNRFLIRIFQDVMADGADAIRFTRDKKGTTYARLKGRDVLFTGDMAAEYFPLLKVWAAQRSKVGSKALSDSLDAHREEVSKFPFWWNLLDLQRSVEGDVEITSALSGSTTVTFKRIVFSRLRTIEEGLGLEGPAGKSWASALLGEPGILLVVSPRPADHIAALNRILSTTQALYGGSFLDTDSEALATMRESRGWIILTTAGQDPIDVLQRAKAQWGVAALDHVRLIAGSASVPRVCVECGRESSPPKESMGQLPSRLRSLPVQRYVIGRGCEKCEHTGVSGEVALWSILDLNLIRDVPEARGLDHTVLVSLLYSRGLVPLLEDGVRRAFQGLTTIESVRAVVQSLPSGYEQVLNRIDDSQETTVVGLDVPPVPQEVKKDARRDRPLVLIAEDDPDQREILEMVFKGASYDVVAAVDGVDAWTKLQASFPDIVVTDLMMPRMDGKELVTTIKSHPIFNRIPIMVLTVVADVDREYSLLDCGAEDYVEKSTQRRILLKRVASLLRRRKKEFLLEEKDLS